MSKSSKPKTLTIPQLLVLSTAAIRPDLMILPLPPSVCARGASQHRLLTSLLTLMLVEDVATDDAALSWRTADDGTRYALRLTQAGLAAVAAPTAPVDAGNAEPDPDLLPAATENAADAGHTTACGSDGTDDKPAPQLSHSALPSGKLGQVLAAMQRDTGATLDELVTLTGWLPHTTRAALTRLKQRGVPIALTRVDGRKAYRVTGQESA